MNKQNQKTEENSQALQAGRDIIINDYRQIKEICEDLFKLNFPELIKEAADQAKNNLTEYIDILIKSIDEQERDKIQEKLKTPNAQYILNQSIQNAARYGKKINYELLTRAIKQALTADDEFLENIFEETSIIIPKLNRSQLILILVNFIISGLGFKEEIVIPEFLEAVMIQIFNDKLPFPNIKDSQRKYLISLGIWTYNHFASGSADDILIQRYPNKYKSIILPAIQSEKMPNFNNVILFYNSNNLVKYLNTPIASAIGYLLTKEKIPTLDPNILNNI